MNHKKTPKEMIDTLVRKGIRRSWIAAFCGIGEATVTRLAKGITHKLADSANHNKLVKLFNDNAHLPNCLFHTGQIAGVLIEREFLQEMYEAMDIRNGFNANHVVTKIIAKHPALEAKRANVLPWAKKFIIKLEKMGLIKRDGAMWVAV
jgi:DNA-binding CsgD family transcriptional regulator